ncbi:HD domain-containing protein [Candidatus Pacearchaeota archaeon]|nr:HD domain-containing protein [Candidatus Pacearchaeota archaeon]
MNLTKKQKEIISKVHDYVKEKCEGFSELDNVFEKHVSNVVRFSQKLSSIYGANTFVVVLAAYLHDLYYIQTKNHNIHEIEGSKFAKKYLIQFEISEKEINLISLCILNHRGSKKNKRESIEEKIVSCADAMDHINRSIEMFFRTIHGRETYEEAFSWIRKKLKRSWEKIELEKAREIVRKKYEAAKILFEID